MFYAGRLPHAIIIEGNCEQEIKNICEFLTCIILCQSNDLKSHPCKSCKSCKKVISNIHPDFISIEGKTASKSIHVEDIRQIISESYIIPSESDSKVFIIKNAENMTIQAQNALLKLLEDPPKGVFLILTCRNLDSILKTVQSRAQIFNLSDNSKNSELINKSQALDCANLLLEALAKNNIYDFLTGTAPLVKNKELLKQVLEEMQIILGKTMEFYYLPNKNISENALTEILSQNFSLSALINKQKIISETYTRMEYNANQNLNLTWLCANFFDHF